MDGDWDVWSWTVAVNGDRRRQAVHSRIVPPPCVQRARRFCSNTTAPAIYLVRHGCGLPLTWRTTLQGAAGGMNSRTMNGPPAESWRFPPLSLQCALKFTRAFSGVVVQQANSR